MRCTSVSWSGEYSAETDMASCATKTAPLPLLSVSAAQRTSLVVAHILRFGEIHKLVFRRAAELLDKLSGFSVVVVVNRAATVIGKVAVFLRH